jgi:hypothetical protein
VDLTLAGAATREVADELRTDLVADNVYELSTRGADVAGKFEYVLKASGKKPVVVSDTDDPAAETGGES